MRSFLLEPGLFALEVPQRGLRLLEARPLVALLLLLLVHLHEVVRRQLELGDAQTVISVVNLYLHAGAQLGDRRSHLL